MKNWAKSVGWFSAGIAFTVAVALLAGSALAGGGFGPRPGGAALGAGATGWAPRGGGMWGGWSVSDVVARDLGLTQEELRAGLQEYGSIARLAEVKGVSLDQVKADILAAVEAQHEELVAAGKLTEEQAAAGLQRFTETLDQKLTAERPLGPGPGMGPRGGRAAAGPGAAGPGVGRLL